MRPSDPDAGYERLALAIVALAVRDLDSLTHRGEAQEFLAGGPALELWLSWLNLRPEDLRRMRRAA